MKYLALVTLALVGCAAPQPPRNSDGQAVPQQVFAECDYEAAKATAGIANGFNAGWTRGDLRRQCLAMKGYR